MKVRVFFIAVGLLLFKSICAQVIPPNLIPPSPSAYALGKYGDIPVGYYTGVPDISVPLFSLKNIDIAVNTSLSYHGSGIKVDEVASFVGLGWSLNAGGVITRVIHGRAEGLTSSGVLTPARAEIPFWTSGPVEDFINSYNFNGVVGTMLDAAPDVFYYNFQGKSGKFYFDKDGNAVLEKAEGLEIKWQYVSANIQKFILTDEMGVVYEFNDYETTFYGNDDGSKISAWYLSKISSPAGNDITFEYYPGASSDHYMRSAASTLVEILPQGSSITPPIDQPYSNVGGSEIRLHKIVSPNGSIEFKYKTTNRLDYSYSSLVNVSWCALDEIDLLDNNNTLQRKVKLSTSYFEADNARKYDGSNPQNFQFLNYRLRLDAVQEYSAANISMPPYTFTYLGDNDPTEVDDYTLPYRLSPEQDHWGYFNKSNNSHLFPGNSGQLYIPNNKWLAILSDDGVSEAINNSFGGGANREPDAEALKACMLDKVYYPTGGYSQFTFEPNFLSGDLGGLRIKQIVNQPEVGNPITTVYSYSGGTPIDPRKSYYELYRILYTQDEGTGTYKPATSRELLDHLGLPSGNLSSLPNGMALAKYVSIKTEPTAILGPGAQIGYYLVTEEQSGKGKSVYSYDGPEDYPDYTEWEGFDQSEFTLLVDMFRSDYVRAYPNLDGTPPLQQFYSQLITNLDWPNPEIYSNDWKRGVLTEKKTYNSNNVLLTNESREYDRTLVTAVPGYKIERLDHDEFVYTKYFLPAGWIRLKKTTTTNYDQNGQNPLIDVTSYYYDNTAHMLPTRIESKRSDGTIETVVTAYPQDYSSGTAFIDNMTTNHLIGYPIETVKYIEKNGQTTIVSGNIKKYKDGGKGLINEQLMLDADAPIALSSFKFSNRATGTLPPLGASTNFLADNHFTSRINYDYTPAGNINEYTFSSGPTKSFTWGYHSGFPTSEVINAQNNEIFFDSFEDGEGWDGLTAPVYSDRSVTYDDNKSRAGRYSGKIVRMESTEQYSHSNKTLNISLSTPTKFLYSGWYYSDGPSVDIYLFMKRANEAGYYSYVDHVTSAVTGKWVYLEKEYVVPADVTQLNIRLDNNGGGTVWFDDIRLHPSSARMTSYTYEPLVGMTSATDVNNNTTHYVYDHFGRLSIILDKDQNVLKDFCYNYAGDDSPCVLPITFYNIDKSGTYTKNNCGQGEVPESMYVSVPANIFRSTISQEDANNKATQYGQDYVNTHGQCIPMVTVYCSNPNFVSGYQVEFYNTETGEDFFFYVDEFDDSGALGDIPVGTYDIYITSQESTYRNYAAGCNNYNYGYGSASFFGVALNSSCDIISIN